jgi:hypothetical protein
MTCDKSAITFVWVGQTSEGLNVRWQIKADGSTYTETVEMKKI